MQIRSLGTYSDFNTMCDALCKVFKDVAKSEIAEEEEGNVLYFLKRPKDKSQPSEILSLAKLKTLEYRLFRKMREKLRNFHAKEEKNSRAKKGEAVSIRTPAQMVSKFTSEAKELSDEHELPRSLDYYIALFKTAFAFIKEDPTIRTDLLNNEYVTFSEQLLQYFTKVHGDKSFAQNSNFFFSDVLDTQNDISYGTGTKAEHVTKVDIPVEAPKKKVQATPAAPEEEKKEYKIAAFEENKDEEVKQTRTVTQTIQAAPKAKRTVIFIIPFGVPGSGKSFCWDALKGKFLEHKDEVSFESISSDGMRGAMIE